MGPLRNSVTPFHRGHYLHSCVSLAIPSIISCNALTMHSVASALAPEDTPVSVLIMALAGLDGRINRATTSNPLTPNRPISLHLCILPLRTNSMDQLS